MNETAPLLIEIGTEEIPAGVSDDLAKEFFNRLDTLLGSSNLAPEQLTWGVTPRRIIVLAPACYLKQDDYNEEIWGPPEKVAFDAEGNPTKAAEGFARKSGLLLDDFTLADKGDGKGKYMSAVVRREGLCATDVLAEALPEILRKLQSPKQMQWQDGKARADAFIRPVRWIVARLGDDVISFSFAGVQSGKTSYGHRTQGASGEIDVNDPLGWLRGQKVEADRSARMQLIRERMNAMAAEAGVSVVTDDDLVAEIADLTEWPVPVLCEFSKDFLRLPEDVIRITLKNHQRCFTTHDANDAMSNKFIAVANIESKDPLKVAEGNARVVNARLADAAFYFDRDPKETLDARVEKLSHVAFQEGLGMVGDQVRRLRAFVLDNARAVGADPDAAQRAAYLCKSDLTTGLVYEFPELQGFMGGVYARMNGEPEKVACAIAEHYRPTGADDALPQSPEARMIAIAERLDKLLGYFHLDKAPTASADPFGLRRAAIGLIRLLADHEQSVRMLLSKVIDEAAKQWNQQRVTVQIDQETKQQVRAFVVDRLLGMAAQLGVGKAPLDAAISAGVERPLAEQVRVASLLTGFADSETGQAVAAANKRIINILKKADVKPGDVDTALLTEDAERALFASLEKAEAGFPDEPEAQLEVLAGLRESVDRFFDDVMVMADDEKLRSNRLALLDRLRFLFMRLADFSKLGGIEIVVPTARLKLKTHPAKVTVTKN